MDASFSSTALRIPSYFILPAPDIGVGFPPYSLTAFFSYLLPATCGVSIFQVGSLVVFLTSLLPSDSLSDEF